MHDNFDILRARSDAAADVVVRQFERIICILKGFNPNQPRDEIGRWSGGGSYQAQRKPTEGIQVVQRTPIRGTFSGIRRINGRDFSISITQQIRLDGATSRAQAAIARVRERQPNWNPRPSMAEGVEGEIATQEFYAREAEARLQTLRFEEYMRGSGNPNSAQSRLEAERMRIQDAMSGRIRSGSLEDILLQEGRQIGVRLSGVDTGIRTVSQSEFDSLRRFIESNQPVSRDYRFVPRNYDGDVYLLQGGSLVGIRNSIRSGPTIDVIQSDNPTFKPGYKVHGR